MTGASAPPAFRLPMRVDAAGLLADLDAVMAQPWYPHPNQADYDRDWSVLCLRSLGGNPRRTISAPVAAEQYADTPILASLANFRAAIAAFPMPLRSVRLLRLGAGANIKAHSDHGLGYQDGQVRFHLPIITSPDVDFTVAGRRLDMRPGEVWYADLNQIHSVSNRSTVDRIHLTIDGEVNAWVDRLFREAARDLLSSPTVRADGH